MRATQLRGEPALRVCPVCSTDEVQVTHPTVTTLGGIPVIECSLAEGNVMRLHRQAGNPNLFCILVGEESE